jgi:Type VI secretion system (T6SS), amidase effector protein 4
VNKLSALMGVSILVLSACTTLPKADLAPEGEAAVEIETKTPEKPKYKPLVYGAEKSLVCTDPVLAQGKLGDRPNLQVMWENYLYDRPAGIWGEIGGLVEVNGNLPFDQGQWTNACTVRLSHMLNKADHKIPRVSKKTVSGGNKDQYYYRVADLEAYLIERYGHPDVEILDGSGNQFDLPITPGIVLMDFPNNSYTGHVTIWNGAGTVDGANIGGYRVLFWDLPCYIPAGRQPIAEVKTSVSAMP